MDEKEWTIDTHVLYKAADNEFPAIRFLLNVLKRHKAAFDHEGHIEKEYRACFNSTQRDKKPGSPFIKKWFAEVVAKKARIFFSGKLSERHKGALLSLDPPFDDDDLPFVAVCAQTQSKLLVAEETDYSEPVKDYLSREMGIRVLTIAEAEKESER